MASAVYNTFKKDILGALNIASATLKVMLVDNTYPAALDVDSHDFRDDVTGYEVSGTGYSAGGKTLTTVTVTQDNTDDESVLDADDVVWSSSTITARGAIIYVDVGTAATDNLIGFVDFGTDKVSSGGDLTIQWNAEGILNFT